MCITKKYMQRDCAISHVLHGAMHILSSAELAMWVHRRAKEHNIRHWKFSFPRWSCVILFRALPALHARIARVFFCHVLFGKLCNFSVSTRWRDIRRCVLCMVMDIQIRRSHNARPLHPRLAVGSRVHGSLIVKYTDDSSNFVKLYNLDWIKISNYCKAWWFPFVCCVCYSSW